MAGPPLSPITLLPLPRVPRSDASERVLVGRGEDCDVVLAHPGVSRHHCVLNRRDGRWWVRDLGSTHGTIVDGARIPADQEIELPSGGTLAVGPWVLRLRQGEGDTPVVVPRPKASDAETLATRPTIFLRLHSSDTMVRELSWQAFRDRYAPVILGFARHAGLTGDAAEDVLQDVLLAFFRVSPKFEYDPAKGRFRGYLKTATLNVIRRRHRRAAPMELTMDPADDDAEDPQMAQRWEEEWEASLVQRAMAEVRSHVDPRTWEAFELYVQREMPSDEVARRTGLAINSVHQAKSRVLRAVRTVIERLRQEEG